LTGLEFFAVIAGFPNLACSLQEARHEAHLPTVEDPPRPHPRVKTRGGRAVINARRAKGRKRLAV